MGLSPSDAEGGAIRIENTFLRRTGSVLAGIARPAFSGIAGTALTGIQRAPFPGIAGAAGTRIARTSDSGITRTAKTCIPRPPFPGVAGTAKIGRTHASIADIDIRRDRKLRQGDQNENGKSKEKGPVNLSAEHGASRNRELFHHGGNYKRKMRRREVC